VAYALGLCSYMMQSSMVSVSFSPRCLWIYVYAGESAHSVSMHAHTHLHTFVYIRRNIRIHPCTSAYTLHTSHTHPHTSTNSSACKAAWTGEQEGPGAGTYLSNSWRTRFMTSLYSCLHSLTHTLLCEGWAVGARARGGIEAHLDGNRLAVRAKSRKSFSA
jgi:hypothetical protein